MASLPFGGIPTDWASLFVTLFWRGDKNRYTPGNELPYPTKREVRKNHLSSKVSGTVGDMLMLVLRRVYIPESTNVPNGQVRYTRFMAPGHPGHRLPLPGTKSDHAVPCGGRLQGGGFGAGFVAEFVQNVFSCVLLGSRLPLFPYNYLQ